MKKKIIIMVICSVSIILYFIQSCSMATNENLVIPEVESSSITIKEYAKEISKSAGIIYNKDSLSLDTKYYPENKYLIYYGTLDESGISDYSQYDLLVVADQNYKNVSKARMQGCSIFQYIYFGSKFENTDEFINGLKIEINSFVDRGLADGIFIDECDIGYWEKDIYDEPEKIKIFYDRLKEVTQYCKSIGLETIVNGSRAYAELGDYYLWEDYLAYWETNEIKWSIDTTGRTVNESGATIYDTALTDWKLEGSCKFDGGRIVDGSNGAAEIIIDLDKIILKEDQKDLYDWIYFKWSGSGATDETCKIWAWTGDKLPFDEGTWEKLPKLGKGRPEASSSIGEKSKYLKLRMEFNGAKNLEIDSILLRYNYKYPYWNMIKANEEADRNPHIWNYNNTKRDYLWQKMDGSGDKVKVLTLTYGEENDQRKNMYAYLTSKIWGYYSNAYAHPMLQNVYNTEATDNPVGILLKRDGENTGYFTGAIATVNPLNYTYTLKREEPDYWYHNAIRIDGNYDDWSKIDKIYENPIDIGDSTKSSWYLESEGFKEGAFDNVKIVNDNGYDILELIHKGKGTWTSPTIELNNDKRIALMKEITWNGGGEGTINYDIQYRKFNGEWIDWQPISEKKSSPETTFIAFKVRITLNGEASYSEKKLLKDKNGQPYYKDVYNQGISFWGSGHKWETYDDGKLWNEYINVNINNLSITDDIKNLYISFEGRDSIDIDKGAKKIYSIFMDAYGDRNKGYKESGENRLSGVNFKIQNKELFVWDDNKKEWVENENSGMTYKLSSDKKRIEYSIPKRQLGGLPKSDLNIYVQVKNVSTGDVDAIPSDINKNMMTYSQKYFNLKVPHGFYASDEVILDKETKSVNLEWKERKPSNTDIKAWVRTRNINQNWTDWIEVKNGKSLNTEGAIRYQYCFGLYTTDGKNTPIVEQIQVKQED